MERRGDEGRRGFTCVGLVQEKGRQRSLCSKIKIKNKKIPHFHPTNHIACIALDFIHTF